MESRCKTQAGRTKWANIHSNWINLQLPLNHIQKAIDLGSYKVHSDSYIFWSGLWYLFIVHFSIYNFFFFGFCRSFLQPQCVCTSVCSPRSPATSEVPAQRLPPIYSTEKGEKGCGSLKSFSADTSQWGWRPIPCCWPDPFPWRDANFCPALAKQWLHTGGGF